ncbi:hypothetical protein EYF80_067509 [Liparis tanakae]|uniref:Uncharacterized protein n=1 Tax=Liparis tanakae TaxID=230148 RepID=A0A4Z2E0Y2_9TELE|nr:hypothetical protein EYF80_067509 [Liparis tanakae]
MNFLCDRRIHVCGHLNITPSACCGGTHGYAEAFMETLQPLWVFVMRLPLSRLSTVLKGV